LVNETAIDAKDLIKTEMGKTDDFELGTLQMTKPIVQHLTTPSNTNGLLLPPWRNCQVGASAELKQHVVKPEDNNPTDNAPTSSLKTN